MLYTSDGPGDSLGVVAERSSCFWYVGVDHSPGDVLQSAVAGGRTEQAGCVRDRLSHNLCFVRDSRGVAGVERTQFDGEIGEKARAVVKITDLSYEGLRLVEEGARLVCLLLVCRYSAGLDQRVCAVVRTGNEGGYAADVARAGSGDGYRGMRYRRRHVVWIPSASGDPDGAVRVGWGDSRRQRVDYLVVLTRIGDGAGYPLGVG